MDLDTDISHYTIDELQQLLGINTLTTQSILEASYKYYEKYILTNKSAANFFLDVKDKLLQHVEPDNTNQATTKTYVTGVDKGIINPDLKNVLIRLINIDSFYRQTINFNNGSTDSYPFTLNEPILDVLSLTLYSIEIPYSWYTFTKDKGTTGFRILTTDPNNNVVYYDIYIPDGNYSSNALIAIMNQNINDTLNLIMGTNITWWILKQNAATGTVYFDPVGNGFPTVVKLIWFDPTYVANAVNNATINSNLGWILGFRYASTVLFPQSQNNTPIIAPAIIDTSGTKYILISLTDYKTNRINKGMIGINNIINTQVAFPTYLNTDIQRFTVGTTSNSIQVNNSAPRHLTAAQVHTINAISTGKSIASTRVRITSSDDSDVFAKIPLKRASSWGSYDSTEGIYTAIEDGPAKLIVEFSGPIQSNTREYFGPVDISNMKVTLYDDKGNLLGLNGMDWSFTLIAKSLYQY